MYIWSSKKFFKTHFVLIIFGIFTIILFLSKEFYRNQESTTKKYISVTKTETEITTPHLLHPKVIPECKEDTSVANISDFSKLADHIKDFLRYRHCRNFQVLHDIPSKCDGPQQSDKVFLFLVIKSSPRNYERREVIRKTWGQERVYSGMQIRRLFILGVTSNENERKKFQKLIHSENQNYGDMLQWDFYDTFFNLTLKQVLFYNWLMENCPHVKFLFNGDDDVFVNSNDMVHYLLGLKGNDGNEHLYVGQLITHVGPIRSTSSKYCVPKEVFPSNSYPPYCAGGGIVMSGFTARQIYNSSLSVPIMPIDDVYLGICLQKAGLSPASHMAISTIGVRTPSGSVDSFDPCYYRGYLVVHRLLSYELIIMWEAIHDPNLKCGISKL